MNRKTGSSDRLVKPTTRARLLFAAWWGLWLALAITAALMGCHPPDGSGRGGWPGEHTPTAGEPCSAPGVVRCAAPPDDSRAVLRCGGGEWAPAHSCQGSATCNWASDSEAYCAVE